MWSTYEQLALTLTLYLRISGTDLSSVINAVIKVCAVDLPSHRVFHVIILLLHKINTDNEYTVVTETGTDLGIVANDTVSGNAICICILVLKPISLKFNSS